MRLFLALLAAGCAADADSGCPSSPSSSACAQPGKVCSYDDQVCECSSGWWYCRPGDCPTEEANGACSGPLTCVYGFEDTAICIDGQWLHCGGVLACLHSASEAGQACCGGGLYERCPLACPGGDPSYCHCQAHHWVCDQCTVDGGTTNL